MDEKGTVQMAPESSSTRIVGLPAMLADVALLKERIANTGLGPASLSQGSVGASTRAQTRKEAPPQESEADFMGKVVELARLEGWKVYHTHDSRRSDPGFPDLVLCRDGHLLFWELKSAKGDVKAAQLEWIEALSACPGVDVGIYRPQDWDLIVGQLGG